MSRYVGWLLVQYTLWERIAMNCASVRAPVWSAAIGIGSRRVAISRCGSLAAGSLSKPENTSHAISAPCASDVRSDTSLTMSVSCPWNVLAYNNFSPSVKTMCLDRSQASMHVQRKTAPTLVVSCLKSPRPAPDSAGHIASRKAGSAFAPWFASLPAPTPSRTPSNSGSVL